MTSKRDTTEPQDGPRRSQDAPTGLPKKLKIGPKGPNAARDGSELAQDSPESGDKADRARRGISRRGGALPILGPTCAKPAVRGSDEETSESICAVWMRVQMIE